MENQNPQISPISPTPPQNVPAEQSQPVSNPINPPTGQKSKFPLGVIIGIILFLLVAGSAAGFYFFKQQNSKLAVKPTPTPSQTITPSPTPDPTASWKIYANSKLGFSLKYPNTWDYNDLGKNGNGANQIIFGDPSRKTSGGNGTTILAGNIDLEVYDKNKLGNYMPLNSQVKIVKINNLTIQESHSKSCPSNNDCITVIFDTGNNAFILIPLIDSEKYKDLDIIYKMLSTFKFTDQIPTPTCMQRPACLDATPRCLIAEPANGWCPASQTCNTDADCASGSSCMTSGPLVAGQAVRKTCVQKGTAVPL